MACADIPDEPIVGMAGTALAAHFAARRGRQLGYRIQLRNTEHAALHLEAWVAISSLSDAAARSPRRDLAIPPPGD